MKIFNLGSKTNLILWSVVVGIIVDGIAIQLTYQKLLCPDFGPDFLVNCDSFGAGAYGWPIKFFMNNAINGLISLKGIVDLLCLILIVFAILFSIRHFKNKNLPSSEKQT